MSDYDYSLHYRRFHDESEAHAEASARATAGCIQRFLPDHRDQPAIDIGCGFGFGLRALRSLGFSRLEGVESSPEQAVRSRNAGFEVSVTDDTEAYLRQRPGRYGLALLLDVLEHIPVQSQIAFLRAIHTSLQPGGRLVLSVPNANSILAPRWRYIDYTHHSSFTEHSLRFVLANAGFGNLNLDNYKGPGPFPRRFWRIGTLRRWLVRFCWLQVYRAELPGSDLSEVSFELNLYASATKLPA